MLPEHTHTSIEGISLGLADGTTEMHSLYRLKNPRLNPNDATTLIPNTDLMILGHYSHFNGKLIAPQQTVN